VPATTYIQKKNCYKARISEPQRRGAQPDRQHRATSQWYPQGVYVATACPGPVSYGPKAELKKNRGRQPVGATPTPLSMLIHGVNQLRWPEATGPIPRWLGCYSAGNPAAHQILLGLGANSRNPLGTHRAATKARRTSTGGLVFLSRSTMAGFETEPHGQEHDLLAQFATATRVL
jgi:hypothetical protein